MKVGKSSQKSFKFMYSNDPLSELAWLIYNFNFQRRVQNKKSKQACKQNSGLLDSSTSCYNSVLF